MKKTLTILFFSVLISIKLFAQEPLRDVPFNIDASKDTTLVIQLDKINCISTTNFHPNYLSIPPQAPFFYVSVNYNSNCGTIDRMKVKISSDTIYLIQADSGSLMTCECEYGYAMIFQNYQQDSCIVVFGDTLAVYHNPATTLTENTPNSREILIKNPFKEILQIDLIADSNNKASYSMELYGIEGRLIRIEILKKSSNSFDTQSLNNGAYILIIKNNGIIIKKEKLIKT